MSTDPQSATTFPLSFAQQRLWFLEQLEGPGPVYNVRLPVRLTGVLDRSRLDEALAAVVARHETLRTTFAMRAGEPVQVVHDRALVPLEFIDRWPTEKKSRSGSTAVAEPELRTLIGELAATTFDLARGPLLRAVLVRIAPDEHVLLLVTHHIVSDAWSSGVLFRDLMTEYEARIAGHEAALPELAVQYADFAVWQRDWLQGEELDRQAEFWLEHLDGAPALLELPADRPRPALQTYDGSRIARPLSAALTGRLRRRAAEEGVTPFMLLFAAFNLLLSRWTGQTDLVVGTPIAGRRRSELEPLVGFFANTLALRTRLDGIATFRELLHAVRKNSLAAFEHQDLPFEKLVELLKPARLLSHSPVFQVMFIQQNAPWENVGLSALKVAPAEMASADTAKFELTVSASEYEGTLWLAFEYNTGLFDAATIGRFADAYETLLGAVAEEPGSSLAALPAQSAADRERVLRDWNATGAAWDGPSQSVYALFAAQAAHTPDAVAVESGGRVYSYAELQAQAGAIAGLLRECGAGPGRAVAICLERSTTLLAAVLGVLRAGAHYLPLDPAHPAARLAFIAADSGARILLAEEATVERLPDFDGDIVLLPAFSQPAPPAADLPDLNLPDIADELAYLIYTSGSTGQPKGVRVPQRAVVNFLQSMARTPGINAADRLLAVTTLAFDISVLELLLPLTVGATTVIATREDSADPRRLMHLLDTAAITVLQATPATWRNLLAAGWRGTPGLTMLCGGEALDAELAGELLGRGAALWNLYGPTETTVWSCCVRITSAVAPVSVGRPIANTRCYVLDGDADAGGLRPVPIGVRGELWIGGAGVAAGYHERAELTAERFRADPFAPETFPGEDVARIYRTGDVARQRSDGSIEILGRTDFQIKLRGFRIEPGEIEAELWALPGVAAAVVIERAGRLIGYAMPSTGAALDGRKLREWLGRRLPDYMVPSVIVCLQSLPLTPNGKIDRQALPAPEPEVVGASSGLAPRTPLEEAVCGLMAEVLDLPAVGVEDDFFNLGGHSLLATQLVSRIRDTLRVELPLKSLFLAPTAADIAAAIGTLPAGSGPVGTTDAAGLAGLRLKPAPAGNRPEEEAIPLSLPQQRLWFLDRLQPGNPVYNLVWAVRLDGPLDARALRVAVAAVVGRHESLRTRFSERDGEAEQVVLPAAAAGVEVQFRDAGEIPVSDVLRDLARQPFDLVNDPPLRVTVLNSGPDEYVLALVVHHIVADGWSFGVLSRELSLAYAAALRGEAPAFAPLPVQYADYARWQRDWLAGDEPARQLDYWRRQLAGAPPVLELLPDRTRPSVATHRGARRFCRIDAPLLKALHALARTEGCTLYMVLLAAFDVVLARYGGTEDVVVGTPVAGRGRSELEGLVGFFVNTLVLRTDLAGNPDFRTLLARVKDVTLDAYANADVPFEQLVEMLKPPRDTARTPLFQVMFNLHNEPAGRLEFSGLTTMPVGVERSTAKFDLTVSLTETAEGLAVSLEYGIDLFTPSWAERFTEDFEAVLRAAVRDPDERLSTLGLPCRSGASRDSSRPAARGIAAGAAPTGGVEAGEEVASHAAPIAGGLTLPLAFAAMAAAQPSRPAVSVPGTVWTYAELAAEAARIAAALTATDTGSRIGLWFGHGAGQVAGLLGVLQAGKAYVPLDPLAPPARLEALMQATGLRTVVTERASVETSAWLQDRLAATGSAGLRLLVRDELPPASLLDAVALLDTLPADPDAEAYVLGTSGSTGEPKRVSQTHRNVLHLVGAWSAKLGLTTEDRLSLLSTYGYDAAVQDVFGALLTGAELHPLDVRGLDREVLLDRIASAGLTVLHATPTVYRHLFGGHVACRQDLSQVRLVVLGGETARRSDLELFRSRFRRGARLVNGYGLTEATAVLQYFADHDSRPYGLQLPIGDPEQGVVGDQRVLLLDEAGEPAGVTGELALVSRYRSPGPPAALEAGTAAGTVWRTGDLARRLPDGTLAWTGRRDRQLKLGGIRIEPGEVEAALLAQPGIDEAAVVLDTAGVTPLLVAYVAGIGVPPVDEIRSGMKSRLPAALVPSRYAVLETLPKRPNGKVDHDALPAGVRFSGDPASVAAEAGACRDGDEPPAGVAGVVARVWSELLGIDAIGAEDDFFALGGHSLLAMRLIARLRERLGVELPLIAVFEQPTVAGMARVIDELPANTAGGRAGADPIVRQRRGGAGRMPDGP